MALSWSMDKLGPICRTVEDCAIVLSAIHGSDERDPSAFDVPFNYVASVDLKRLKLGYLRAEFDSIKDGRAHNDAALATLRSLGVELIPIALPKYPVNDLSIILSAECAAAFDELTRSGRDDLLVRQVKNAWPNVFRVSRLIPAVEYLQANRVRYALIEQMATLMDTIDVYVAPPFEGDNLLLTNLTGHPQVVVPHGFSPEGTPTSITFVGRLFDEGTLLAVAKRFQDATEFHLKRPRLKE
jgi:Asp-tRNA(Asn)/Glu-tRNA(Gln) amidotransferase A subunit family amidase